MSLHALHTQKKSAARCPRFDSCNAPICPLDDWQRAQHLEGEGVCGLLSELVKDGGEARLRASLPSALVGTLVSALPKVAARWQAIRSQLVRASRTGSKLEAMQRVHRRGKALRADNITRPAATVLGKPCVLRSDVLDSGSSAIGGTDGSR